MINFEHFVIVTPNKFFISNHIFYNLRIFSRKRSYLGIINT